MNAEEQKRDNRLRLLEDDIGRKLQQSHANGELRSAPSYGKPLNLGDGYEQTPEELRMGMKILKDAGVVPPEVELMQQIEAASVALASISDEVTANEARARLSFMRQQLALRLEKLRISGTL